MKILTQFKEPDIVQIIPKWSQEFCGGDGITRQKADDKFVILVVKMIYGRCLCSARSITRGFMALCDRYSWLLADILPYIIFTTRINDSFGSIYRTQYRYQIRKKYCIV